MLAHTRASSRCLSVWGRGLSCGRQQGFERVAQPGASNGSSAVGAWLRADPCAVPCLRRPGRQGHRPGGAAGCLLRRRLAVGQGQPPRAPAPTRAQRPVPMHRCVSETCSFQSVGLLAVQVTGRWRTSRAGRATGSLRPGGFGGSRPGVCPGARQAETRPSLARQTPGRARPGRRRSGPAHWSASWSPSRSSSAPRSPVRRRCQPLVGTPALKRWLNHGRPAVVSNPAPPPAFAADRGRPR